MSLHERIVDSNNHIFNAEIGFAEEVVCRPDGLEANAFPVNAIVDWGDEEGANQIRGEGRNGLNRDKGRATRTTPIVELPISRVDETDETLLITVTEDGKYRIVVKNPVTGLDVTLSVKRIIGRDEAAQSVLCHFETQHQTQTRKSRFG